MLISAILTLSRYPVSPERVACNMVYYNLRNVLGTPWCFNICTGLLYLPSLLTCNQSRIIGWWSVSFAMRYLGLSKAEGIKCLRNQSECLDHANKVPRKLKTWHATSSNKSRSTPRVSLVWGFSCHQIVDYRTVLRQPHGLVRMSDDTEGKWCRTNAPTSQCMVCGKYACMAGGGIWSSVWCLRNRFRRF